MTAEIVNGQEMTDQISKFAQETYEEISKMANTVTADGLDSGSATVSRKFTDMIRLIKPVLALEEKGVIRVQEVEDNTDKAIFTTQVQQSYTWTIVDQRGSEKSTLAAGSGSYQSYTGPQYLTVTPLTRSTTLQIHDNIRLVNPIRMAEIMAQSMEEVASAKEANAYSVLAASASYTASVSIKFAGGYTTATGTITSANVLTPSDLVSAKKDLKTNGNRKVVADVVIVATEQLSDLETSSDFSPGQSSNSNFKKAVFDENGTLVKFDGMDIVEAVQMPAITTGYFVSSNGHYAYVGKKGNMLGRGEDNKRNKVETWRDPKTHVTELTLDVNFDTGHLFSKATRAICCDD